MILSGSPEATEEDGVLKHQVRISNAEFSSDQFDVQLQGGDIAYVMSGFSDTFTSFVKTYVMTKFDTASRNALEQSINSRLEM
jgi:hypothetical protein